MFPVIRFASLALGFGIVGLGSYGTYLLINREPYAYTLDSKELSINDSPYSSKLGGIEANKKVLVANNEKNNEWFEWVFKNRLEIKKENIDNAFTSITKGYSSENSDNTTDLNKVCDSFYKKGKSDLNQDENKKKSSIKWFCTIGGNKNVEIPNS